MKIGPLIRRMFGRNERRVSEAYRSMYIDMDAFIKLMLDWQPAAANVLEVGCGEGAVTERLTAAYPQAQITAIDITPRVGRLYRGSAGRVRFIQCDAAKLAAAESARFDLIVLSDVLHHVPREWRSGLLASVKALLAPDGVLVFKDWERNHSPIHWLCHASDRWLTGDRISYMTRSEMRGHLSLAFGDDAIVAEGRIGPWWNNIATLVKG